MRSMSSRRRLSKPYRRLANDTARPTHRAAIRCRAGEYAGGVAAWAGAEAQGRSVRRRQTDRRRAAAARRRARSPSPSCPTRSTTARSTRPPTWRRREWIVDNQKDAEHRLRAAPGRHHQPQHRRRVGERRAGDAGSSTAKCPYFFCPGNHDYSDGGGCKDRTTRLNDYFPVAQFRDRPTFGGIYDKEPDRMENSYHLFSAGGRDFLVLCPGVRPARATWSAGPTKSSASTRSARRS